MTSLIETLMAACRHQMRRPVRHRHWRLLLATLLALVCWFAFKPATGAPEWAHMDKVRHISAFATLALVASRGWPPVPQRGRRVAVLLMAYGIFIELVQTQLPTRSGSLADWGADAVGITLGLVLVRVFSRATQRAT